jgi:uncharacterized protein YecT (DUF1311 family)
MIETPKDQATFTLADLPVGRYHVIGYPYAKEGSSTGAVAWTRAARCIKGPCDHTLLAVQVVAGKTAGGVLLADWYAPAGTLPPDPVTVTEKPAVVIDCEKEPDPARRDDCHKRAQEAADQIVNRQYERVLRALEPHPRCHADLRNAQYAWMKFRDQQCAYEGAMSEKGRVIRCLRELTEARAAFLQGQSPVGCNR